MCDATDDEFKEIVDLVGMSSKPLHVKRLRKAIDEYKKEMRVKKLKKKPTTMMISSSSSSSFSSNNKTKMNRGLCLTKEIFSSLFYKTNQKKFSSKHSALILLFGHLKREVN